MIRRLFSQLWMYVLWAVAAVMFWGWIFTLLTDTAPARKVTLYADVDRMEETLLAAKLEEELPEGIRMVQAHPFSYVIFNESLLANADIYIVPENEIAELADSFAPMRPPEGAVCYEMNGEVCGIRVYEAASRTGAAASYITYRTDGDDSQDYYLFFGKNSLHTGEQDEAAYEIMNRLLILP